MSITVNQLNQLSAKFGFDISEARTFLGLPVTSKRGRPVASVSEKKVVNRVVVQENNVVKCAVVPEKKTDNRFKTGYHMFMSSSSPKITSELKSKLADGEKIPRGALIREIAIRWKSLSARDREVWSIMAKENIHP